MCPRCSKVLRFCRCFEIYNRAMNGMTSLRHRRTFGSTTAMSALSQKRTWKCAYFAIADFIVACVIAMVQPELSGRQWQDQSLSALPLKADMCVALAAICFASKADIRRGKQKDRLHNGPSETRSDVLTPERQAPYFPSVDNNPR